MDKDRLKKLLAGFTIAGLLAGAAPALSDSPKTQPGSTG